MVINMKETMKETKIDKAFVVDHTVSVTNIRNEKDEIVILENLEGIPGMIDIEFDHERMSVRVVYDSSKVGFDLIEKTLATIGYPISETNWSRMKSAMYRFQDENSKNNASSTVSSCCSHPRGIYTKSNK